VGGLQRFRTSVEEGIAGMLEITTEVEVEPEAVTELLKSEDKT
jgi:hypothetical protein